MFLSICESFQSTILNNSDVRELIPEFYYFPEFLSNLNNTNFGVLNLNEHHLENRRIGNIKVPKWANNSFEEFIKIHRRALESDYVSANLHHWIDLIFGFKQTGEEAKKAINVFFYLTYEGMVDINDIHDPNEKLSTLDQITNFGITPRQLFQKPHPKKNLEYIREKLKKNLKYNIFKVNDLHNLQLKSMKNKKSIKKYKKYLFIQW
ncbi:beige/beach-related [Anaeramoeba flamelloides]|uniref:Beige/beach-related n=1 Tax=Anaeramoeba flamelloides TaxID=1746091 RepID=A0ABQ8X612_9EUKA|nr:beige/beach-related [Anaeramoeba flamelloides]